MVARAEKAQVVATSGDENALGTALELVDYAAAATDVGKRMRSWFCSWIVEANVTVTERLKVHAIRAEVLRKVQKTQQCLMAQSIYKAAAIDSEKVAEGKVEADDAKLWQTVA